MKIMILTLLGAVVALPASAQDVPSSPQWPLEGPVKTPSKALQVPTKLDPVNQSLTDILNSGGRIVSSYIGRTGPVVTVMAKGKYTVCVLVGQNPQTDQNVATSECYALN
ncbi:hypothetical protein [Sphingomonas sp. Leaf17]|uniref:hypothetical protein n=1 Tax=Sphingomonas sp. Leaf17 TaxID=1735683 RepID=UPI000AF31C08|nr:hypothetical protein [Sphingomonas sp. Leaf17]